MQRGGEVGEEAASTGRLAMAAVLVVDAGRQRAPETRAPRGDEVPARAKLDAAEEVSEVVGGGCEACSGYFMEVGVHATLGGREVWRVSTVC